jgi:hypothetical protein
MLLCLLGACVPAETPASQAVEDYLLALSDKDEGALLELSCPDREAESLIEFDALAQVDTVLRELSCREAGREAGAALVACRGKIVSSYGSEIFEYDLEGRIYRVIAEGDRWLVCGYSR